MVRWKRPVARYGALFAALLTVSVVAYHFGMIYLEGEQSTVWQSLQVVVETFTTVGYGSQAGWSDPAMNVLVVVMDLTSFVLVFMALPLVVVPLLEDALESAPPTEVPDSEDHVIIAGHTDRGERLMEELSAWDVEYVAVVEDRDVATSLHEAGVPVVHGDPDSTEGLDSANAGRARAVVADADDQTNASIVLAAREVAPETT
ncbi:MAG: NAD-binding protein, partial [Halobacteriales archaeon]